MQSRPRLPAYSETGGYIITLGRDYCLLLPVEFPCCVTDAQGNLVSSSILDPYFG